VVVLPVPIVPVVPVVPAAGWPGVVWSVVAPGEPGVVVVVVPVVDVPVLPVCAAALIANASTDKVTHFVLIVVAPSQRGSELRAAVANGLNAVIHSWMPALNER
jgi:hypothetical protein